MEAPVPRRSSSPLTVGSLWDGFAGGLGDLLRWPPDVFGLLDRLLDVSEAYRFVVSPPDGEALALPSPDETRKTAREWLSWLDDATEPPSCLGDWWEVIIESAGTTLVSLGQGSDRQACEAILALHATADEACAGLGVTIAASAGPGLVFRARARELLAKTGTLGRFPPEVLRILPRCRASVGGISVRSLSRHVCVTGPGVDVEWHRILGRPHSGGDIGGATANVVLLPWPLRVRARDFRPVPYGPGHMDRGRYGFFEYDPDDRLDVGLVEGVLVAAEDEAGPVDLVVLPEAALTTADIEPLQALLAEHGVWCLIAGARKPAREGLGANWVHMGVRQGTTWRSLTQHKHHRWSLDAAQVRQYHLGAALSPTMRWWEAISVPRRSLQLVDVGSGVTMAALVCEDLAQPEPVAEVVRCIAPALVITLLLDGPQLASRWTARYASVLADDPGCAVCTLSSYGMVRRCQPPGHAPSSVVALWKDPARGITEIPLEDGAQGILLSCHVSFNSGDTADARRHGGNADLTLVGVQSLSAPTKRAKPQKSHGELSTTINLSEGELSTATSWSEALPEASVVSPEAVRRILTEAATNTWRAGLALAAPTSAFDEAVAALSEHLEQGTRPIDLLTAADRFADQTDEISFFTATLLRLAVEQRLFTEARTGTLAPNQILG